MPIAYTVVAFTTVTAAALRSTWSPCGWSMLSSITPLTEAGRGHRFGVTAAWFIAGGALGGSALGATGVVGAALMKALGLDASVRTLLAALACLVATGFDSRLLVPELPHHRRQVNEDWLDEFRPWVYSGGFGLQIGCGLATYIMTAAVYLVPTLGALSASSGTAILLGVAFGTARGVAVLAGFANRDPRRLAAFHRRFAAMDEPVRVTVTVSLIAATLALATAPVTPITSAIPVLALVVGFATATALSRAQADRTVILPSAPLSEATKLDLRTNEPTTA